MESVNGHTAAGDHLRIVEADHYYDAQIFVNGERASVLDPVHRNALIYRDGGSRKYVTDKGRITLPKRLGNPNRVPLLDGRPLVEGKWPEPEEGK